MERYTSPYDFLWTLSLQGTATTMRRVPVTRSMPRRKEANEGEIKDGASYRNTENFGAYHFKESVNSIAYYAEQSFEETIQKTYFIYDIEKQYEPWNEIENSIPVMLNVWKNKHEDIATLFRNRKKQEAEGPMVLLQHIYYQLYIG